METSSVGASSTQTGQTASSNDAFGGVDMDDFLKLLVTELQNQDPLDPMNNQEILQQISQIREIESTQRLTDTLESVLLGQNIVTASNLIGQTVTALTDEAEWVTGKVDRVSLDEGVSTLHVGEHSIDLNNVSEIQGAADE